MAMQAFVNCVPSVVIDSPKYLLMICSRDIDNVAMSLYDINANVVCVLY